MIHCRSHENLKRLGSVDYIMIRKFYSLYILKNPQDLVFSGKTAVIGHIFVRVMISKNWFSSFFHFSYKFNITFFQRLTLANPTHARIHILHVKELTKDMNARARGALSSIKRASVTVQMMSNDNYKSSTHCITY